MPINYRTGNVGQRDPFRSNYRAASVGCSMLPKSKQYESSSSSTSFYSALLTTSSVGSFTQLNRAGSMGPSNKYNSSGYRSSHIYNSRGMTSLYHQDYNRMPTNNSDRLNRSSSYRTTGNVMSSSYSSAFGTRRRLNSGESGMMSSSLSSQTSLPNKSFSYNSDMSRSLNDTSTLKRNCNTGNKFMSMSSYAPSNAYASTGTLLAYRLRFNHLTSTSGFRNSNREGSSSSFDPFIRTKQSTVDNIDDAYNRICNRYGPSSGKTEPPISTSDTTTNTTLNRSSVSVQDESKAIPSQTVDSKDKESIEEAGKLPLSLNTADAKPRTQSADANKKTSTATAINISDNLNDTTIEKTYLKLESPRLQTLPSSPRSADFSSQQTPKPDPFLTDLLLNQRPLQAPDTQLQKMLRLVNFDQLQFQQEIRRADAVRRASADTKPEAEHKRNESKSLTLNSTVSKTNLSVTTNALKTSTKISTTVTSTLANSKLSPALKPTLKLTTSKKETMISNTKNGKMDSKLTSSNGSTTDLKSTNRSSTISKTKVVEYTKMKTVNSSSRPSKLSSFSNANRTQRAERTLDSLVAKLDKIQIEQTNEVTAVATMIMSENSKSADRYAVNTQTAPKFNKPQLPLFFVTQPTAPSTPMSTTSNVTWTVKEVGRSESSSETDEDEEYTTASYEDEDYEDEEDWEDEYDASLTISISANGLHPEDTTKARERSVTPDYECEFDLSLMVAATVGGQQSRRSLGGRTDQLNVLQPPPMFTASVTWDREDGMDEETEEFYAKLNQNDDDEDVNVGCTLSLLDRAAIQDSDEYTTDSEYESEYYEDEYDSDLTDEEEYSEEEMSASSVDAELNVALPSLKPTEIPETMQILSNAKSRSLSPLIRDHRPVITVQPIPAALDVNRPIESLLEDKSAIRKATVNMSLEEQRKAEEIQQELNRQKARANGSVSAMRDRFRQLTPPKAELITYKRSAMLEKKEVERPKRTYAIVKPMINDDFDKQIAELREQMKNKSSQLHNEYKDLSKGIHNKLDQEKLRTMEMEHRELLGKAKDTFSRADEERLIWQQQHISDVEKKHREKLECENQKQLEQKKLAEEKAAVAAADTRKVTRRVRRIGDPKTTEIKKSGVESLETNPPTAAIPQVKTTASLTPHKTAIVLEKKILSPTENKLETPPIELNAERRKSIPTNRRKTMELIRPLDDGEETELNVKHSKNRKRKHQPHRRNRFVRKPFDIDDLLGLSAFTDFEQMDSYFACEIEYKRSAIELQKLKKRRVDAQKIWISQLKDIDKLYKTSELRDIKLNGLS